METLRRQTPADGVVTTAARPVPSATVTTVGASAPGSAFAPGTPSRVHASPVFRSVAGPA